MYSVSSNFIAAAEANARQILTRAYINDSTLLTGEDIIDLSIIEAIDTSSGVSMGSAIASKLEMKIKAPQTPILLTGSSIRPEIAFYGVDEWVPLGKFYIESAKSNDDFNTTYTITAYDGFSKTETQYIPQIPMPNTMAEITRDIASQCGFAIDESTMVHSSLSLDGTLVLSNLPSLVNGVLVFPTAPNIESDGTLILVDNIEQSMKFDLIEATCRQYIGYFAGMMGKSARFDRNGTLAFSWYTNSGYSIPRELQYLGGCKRLTEQNFTAQAITAGVGDKVFTAGSGISISFENPFINQAVLNHIHSVVGTVEYAPMQIKWRGNPAVEAGDVVLVEDSRGEFRPVYVMEHSIRISGGFHSEIKCYGQTEEEISFGTSPTAKKLQQVYTKLQEAIAEATRLLNGSNGGVFEITDEDKDGINDGWIIRTVDSSQFIKANLNGIGITRDGGATYEQAMTVDGINASAIHTGTMSAQRISVGGKIVDGETVDSKTLGDVFSVELDDDNHPVVTIGSSESDIRQKQTNDAIAFVNGAEATVAKFSVTGAEWADMQQMKYCGFVWTKSPVTGNVRFTKGGVS